MRSAGLLKRVLGYDTIASGGGILRYVIQGSLTAVGIALVLDLLLHWWIDPEHMLRPALTTVGIGLLVAPWFFALHGHVSVELHRTKRQLETLLRMDSQTGLLNRGAFIAAFDAEPGFLLIADIDKFKQINDRFGHPVGDRAIAAVAAAIGTALPEGTIVGRLGGEEFAIGLRVGDEVSAVRGAQAICDAVRGLILRAEDDSTVDLSISIGVAAGQKGFSASYLLADRALYLAKAAGRDRVIAAWQMAELDEPRDRRRYDRPGAAEADVPRRASGA